jgi:hypothetical protein
MLIAGIVTEGVAYYFVQRYIVPIGAWRPLQQIGIVGLAVALSLYVMDTNPLWLKMGIVVVLLMAGIYFFDLKILTDLRALCTTRTLEERGATCIEARSSSVNGLPSPTEMETGSKGLREY